MEVWIPSGKKNRRNIKTNPKHEDFQRICSKKPQSVTFTRNYCRLKGKLFEIGKMFRLHIFFLKDTRDRYFFKKHTWKLFESMEDP